MSINKHKPITKKHHKILSRWGPGGVPLSKRMHGRLADWWNLRNPNIETTKAHAIWSTKHEKKWVIHSNSINSGHWEKTILVTLPLFSTPWATPKMKDTLAASSKFRHPKCIVTTNLHKFAEDSPCHEKRHGGNLFETISQMWGVNWITLLRSHPQVCFSRKEICCFPLGWDQESPVLPPSIGRLLEQSLGHQMLGIIRGSV